MPPINGPWLLKWITTGWDKTTKENTGILMIPKKDEASPYYTRASADYAFWGIPYGVKNPAEVALVIQRLERAAVQGKAKTMDAHDEP